MHLIIAMLCNKTPLLQAVRGHKINCVGRNSCNNCNLGEILPQTVWEQVRNGDNKNKIYMKRFSHAGFFCILCKYSEKYLNIS